MIVVNACLSGPVTDGWNYQDNLLTKYQHKLGHEVTIITSQWIWTSAGKLGKDARQDYINDDGVRVIRLPIRGKDSLERKFKTYEGLYETLERLAPDILFIHGVSCRSNVVFRKYLKNHPNVIACADNHGDFSNSATNWLSKNILHRVIWRHYARMLVPYVKKFYGVLPARVDFLKDVYGIPADKCELLVMGADDELVEAAAKPEVRREIRSKYGIAEDDFLIVTGGKINHYRPETLDLMQAVIDIGRDDLKLLVFGTVADELKGAFSGLCKDRHIVFTGWIQSAETYGYFASADLVIFPGLHSVMWEQAVAQGKPCMVRDIEGFHHLDLGGNVCYLKETSVEAMRNAISELLDDPGKVDRMRAVAEEKGKSYFSYADIARRSLS